LKRSFLGDRNVFFSCSIVAKKSNEQYFQQGLLEFFCEFPSWLVFVDMQMDFFCNFLGFLMIDGKIVFCSSYFESIIFCFHYKAGSFIFHTIFI